MKITKLLKFIPLIPVVFLSGCSLTASTTGKKEFDKAVSQLVDHQYLQVTVNYKHTINRTQTKLFLTIAEGSDVPGDEYSEETKMFFYQPNGSWIGEDGGTISKPYRVYSLYRSGTPTAPETDDIEDDLFMMFSEQKITYSTDPLKIVYTYNFNFVSLFEEGLDETENLLFSFFEMRRNYVFEQQYDEYGYLIYERTTAYSKMIGIGSGNEETIITYSYE